MSDRVGFREITLEEVKDNKVAYSFVGGPFGSDLKASDYSEEGIRIIQLQNIRDGYFNNDYKIYTTKDKADELIKCNIFPGDIIIAKMAEPLARACIIPEHEDRYVMASDGIRLVVDEEKYNKFFVLYYINSPEFRNQAIENGTGTTRLRIGLNTLRQLKVHVPSLNEQKKIADILTSVDNTISKTEAIIEQTEKLKKGLMQQLLTKGIGHTKFKQTEIGEIPDSWNVISLDDVAPKDKPVVQTGPFGAQLKSEYFKEVGRPVLNIGNVQEGKLDIEKLNYLDDQVAMGLARYYVTAGDLLFSRMATVGRTAVVPPECNGWLISYHLMRLSVNQNKCNPSFLMNSFIGSKSLRLQVQMESAGGTRAGVNTSILKKLRIALPGIEEQNKIVEILSSVQNRLDKETSYKERLLSLKSGLMQVLLTGKVRVKVDELEAVTT